MDTILLNMILYNKYTVSNKSGTKKICIMSYNMWYNFLIFAIFYIKISLKRFSSCHKINDIICYIGYFIIYLKCYCIKYPYYYIKCIVPEFSTVFWSCEGSHPVKLWFEQEILCFTLITYQSLYCKSQINFHMFY